MAVRRTASPVPPTVVLPPPVAIGLGITPRLHGLEGRDGVAVRLREPRPPGGPPDLVGTVVLVV